MNDTATEVEIVPIPEVGYLLIASRPDGTVSTYTMTPAEFARLQKACGV